MGDALAHPHTCSAGGVAENATLKTSLHLQGQLKGCSWNHPQGGSLPAGLPSLCSGERTQAWEASIAWGSGLNPRELELMSIHKGDRTEKPLLEGV